MAAHKTKLRLRQHRVKGGAVRMREDKVSAVCPLCAISVVRPICMSPSPCILQRQSQGKQRTSVCKAEAIWAYLQGTGSSVPFERAWLPFDAAALPTAAWSGPSASRGCASAALQPPQLLSHRLRYLHQSMHTIGKVDDAVEHICTGRDAHHASVIVASREPK